jgi:hypothetical protein
MRRLFGQIAISTAPSPFSMIPPHCSVIYAHRAWWFVTHVERRATPTTVYRAECSDRQHSRGLQHVDYWHSRCDGARDRSSVCHFV